ncbi:MAG: dTMP kinase [Clostridia bacterium]|nr:dTMP kinase [Clostridia bacterium]
MKYRYYLFDFDGTIADTGEGIRKSVAYSAEKLGYAVPDVEVLNRFIGPPLHDSYKRYFGMTDDQAEHAIQVYRERYIDTGLYESNLYPGIPVLLKALRERGAYVALASAKPQMMLERLTKYFGIDGDLDAISGTDLGRHSADKQDLLMAALPVGAKPEEVCMVGDRCFDIEAAKALGMHAVGADYGYSEPGELKASGADEVYAASPDMVRALLEGDVPRGRFITLEGSDGCGKSTQIARLKDWLERRGYEVALTREPGGCPISERIREVILSLDSKGMSAECEMLLYAASRAEHVREVIKPALKSGKIVICDRFLDSSIAYQAYGRELGEDLVRQINAPAVGDLRPDVTLLLQVDRASARARMARGAQPDRMEIEREDFFERVARGFEAVRAADPERVHVIDAGRSIEEVARDVRSVVEEALNN